MSRWMNDYFHLYIFNVEYLKEKHTKQLYNSPFVTLIKCRQRFNADCPKEKKKYYRKQISRKGSFPQNHLKSYCMLILLNSKWYKRESNHRPNLFEKKKLKQLFIIVLTLSDILAVSSTIKKHLVLFACIIWNRRMLYQNKQI